MLVIKCLKVVATTLKSRSHEFKKIMITSLKVVATELYISRKYKVVSMSVALMFFRKKHVY